MTNQTTAKTLPGWRAFVAGGLACGVLDITAAFTNVWLANGVPPGRVLKAVASGVLGADAFKGGAGVAGFGLLLHFCVAFGWAGVFCLLARKIKFFTEQAIITGVVYGAFVYFAMQHAVLPLAAQFRSLYIPTTKAFVPGFAWPQFGIHLVFVGLAISLAVRHWSRRVAAVPAI